MIDFEKIGKLVQDELAEAKLAEQAARLERINRLAKFSPLKLGEAVKVKPEAKPKEVPFWYEVQNAIERMRVGQTETVSMRFWKALAPALDAIFEEKKMRSHYEMKFIYKDGRCTALKLTRIKE